MLDKGGLPAWGLSVRLQLLTVKKNNTKCYTGFPEEGVRKRNNAYTGWRRKFGVKPWLSPYPVRSPQRCSERTLSALYRNVSLPLLLIDENGFKIHAMDIFTHVGPMFQALFCGMYFELDELCRSFRPNNKLRTYFYCTCHARSASGRQSSPLYRAGL